MPQIRKFYVFFILLVAYSTFRKVAEIRAVVLLWAGIATLSAARSFFQFWRIYRQSQAQHVGFYEFYVGSRITGFMSHWMTFGAEEMIVLLLLAAYLFFSAEQRWKKTGWLCAAILACSMVLGFTRSIFLLGFPLGLLYLLWFWRKWLIAAAPAVVLIAFFLGPQALRERIASVVEPRAEVDSNRHRAVLRETGLMIVRAHPWLGLGPEQVKYQIDRWIPASARPLPIGDYEHLHNVYLQYAAERGLPTLLFFLWMIAKILWDLGRALRQKTVGTEARLHPAWIDRCDPGAAGRRLRRIQLRRQRSADTVSGSGCFRLHRKRGRREYKEYGEYQEYIHDSLNSGCFGSPVLPRTPSSASGIRAAKAALIASARDARVLASCAFHRHHGAADRLSCPPRACVRAVRAWVSQAEDSAQARKAGLPR